MAYGSFEDLDVWRRACRLATDTYKALNGCKDWGLKDQMTRAAVSIASNIAEGAERGSRAEFSRFINIAKSSAAELRTQFYIAGRIGLITKELTADLVEESKAVSAMLHRLAQAQTDVTRKT